MKAGMNGSAEEQKRSAAEQKSSATSARRVARVALGLTGAFFAVFVMVGPSFGAAGIFAQASPTGSTTPSASGSASGTASPSPTGAATPSIKFLNPSQAYDPGLPIPPRDYDPVADEFAPDPPKISDRFDGVDSRYHVSAWVAGAPATRVVELYIQYGTANEQTIGLMDEVPGQPNTYELYWDIPESFAEGAAVMRVRLFAPNASGAFEEIEDDSVTVDVRHKDTIQTSGDNTDPSDETIELTYPTQNGTAGFFKPRGGTWKSVIEGRASAFGSEMDLLYSVTAPGKVVEYKKCGETTLYNKAGYGTEGGSIPWTTVCTLTGKDTPAQLTAMAAVVLDADRPNREDALTGRDELSQDSADVHRVRAYAQKPDDMVFTMDPEITTETPSMARRTIGGCLGYLVTVKDQLGRPVIGANIDAHIVGPNDQMQFGDENAPTTGPVSGAYKNPDKGDHVSEAARDCDTPANAQGTQAEHNIPGGSDVKHRESTTGTGTNGTWRFHIISFNTAGFTNVTAWLDEEELTNESENRPLDTDILEPGEQQVSFTAQWYPSAPTLSFEPAGGTSLVGTCTSYTLRARAGSAAIGGMNIDIHATGPNDQLDFCDPGDASPRQAPNAGPTPGATPGPHEAEDSGEASHPGTPRAQHTEGETDDAGNFTFGITSPVAGDTTLVAWLDKEPGYDNDIQDSGETSASATHSWGASLADASVKFVNPSGYGSGTDIISKKQDADTSYHLVARTDAATGSPQVEFFYSADGITFTSLGLGKQVGTTDTFELFWPLTGVADDTSATLRAQIVGTTKKEDRTIAVDSTANTAEISRPLDAASAPFTKRSTTVAGTASSGAIRVEVYYTKTAAGTTRNQAAWVSCGRQSLTTTAFSTQCTLAATDQASQVTGIAVQTVACDPDFGCEDENPLLGGEITGSGDAHRVFGFDASPIISIEPAEAEKAKTECQRFSLRVVDQTGQAIPRQNVDVHLTGPTDDAEFCNPGDASARTNPGDGGHSPESSDPQSGFHDDPSGANTKHTEGTTSSSGRFIFGVTSPDEGDSQIAGWVDLTDNDQVDGGEAQDSSTMHWVTEVGPHEDKCSIRGTQGDDVINGSDGDDVICGMGGNDIIKGGGGDDLIRAGFGKDTVHGGDGDDTIRGRQGPDKLYGGPGTDTIQGGRGQDRINGGPGLDSCVGGPGRDRVSRCE